jgi:hypothetical protein
MDQASQFSFPRPTLLAYFLPHGHCMRWESGLVGTHVVAGAMITLAYSCIPDLLFLFIKRRVIRLESAEGQGSIFRFTWPKQNYLGREAAC